MADFLRDEVYEGFDWLTKAVEPYTWSVVDELNKLPSKILLDLEDINNIIDVGVTVMATDYTIHPYSVMKLRFLERRNLHIDYTILVAINQILDKTPNQSIVKIWAEKLAEPNDILEDNIYVAIDGSQLINNEFVTAYVCKYWYFKQQELYSHAHYTRTFGDSSILKRLDNVINILNASSMIKKTKSMKKKVTYILDTVEVLLQNKMWNIKNVDLLIKVMSWIIAYIKDSDEKAYLNLVRIKGMTHKNNPIYSMQEIK